ncbi:Ail/Lom family outer membrane beta-barrel protein [Xenorhabdus hominickii]|uniref:Attachment protein n=1 Tax=Xenorhabdus hominickii TaxID=351679 RepID=A0A2G0QFY1_XENHO|nr:Ail/Lom family outer membrane beta-barrel protein [Xenorhabdus hominickii]AOM42110.1 attachment protein [Xenorhabdus hominickii]PHM58108.1 virulence-related outer membrane protein [Xenorhabdus hominickii]
MKKILLISAVVAGLSMTSFTANASGENKVSAGYALSKVQITDFKDLKEPKGFNLKYRYEITNNFGVIGSFTRTSQKDTYSDSAIKSEVSQEYNSFMAEPAYRFNEYISAYGLLGAAYGKISSYNSQYNRTHSLESNTTAAAYGAGLQFNPSPNVAIDVSFEYSKLDEAQVGTWVLGTGYRF